MQKYLQKNNKGYVTFLGMAFETLRRIDKEAFGITNEKELGILNVVCRNAKSLVGSINDAEVKRGVVQYCLHEDYVSICVVSLDDISFSWCELSPKFADSKDNGLAVSFVSDATGHIDSCLFLENDYCYANLVGNFLLDNLRLDNE